MAAAQAITLGSNLFLTGTTLNATTGTASNPAGPATACNFANSSVTSFQADLAACAINSTSHALTSQILNGVQNAASYQTGGGNNGIANASAGATGATVTADPTYPTTEQYTYNNLIPNVPNQFHFMDLRGYQGDFFHNWQSTEPNFSGDSNDFTAHFTACLSDGTTQNVNQGAWTLPCGKDEIVSFQPGWSFGNPQYGANNWLVSKVKESLLYSAGAGIVEAASLETNHFSVGDTIGQYHYTSSVGGNTAPSDEGVKGFGNSVGEFADTYTATCTSGCTTGSTNIKTSATLDAGEQGTSRLVIDKTSGVISTTTSAIATGITANISAVTVAATVPISNAWGTLNGNCGPNGTGQQVFAPPFSQSYTCNITVASGTFDTSHLVCIGSQFHECSIPTATTSTSITLPLRVPHVSGGPVFQGGMAGYGMEFSFFTSHTITNQNLRYVFDILGSTDAHTVQGGYYRLGSLQPVILNQAIAYGSWPATTPFQ